MRQPVPRLPSRRVDDSAVEQKQSSDGLHGHWMTGYSCSGLMSVFYQITLQTH